MIQPFHLAIPVQNLEKCRTFYRDILNCKEGRSSDHWVDFDFFGHQLVIHQKDDFIAKKFQILLMAMIFLFLILELF